MPDSDVRQRIVAVVRRIPRGRVATYGQVAALAGRPRNARQVGAVLKSLPDDSGVPWHRVINAQGRISERGVPAVEGLQRHLLKQESVQVDSAGRVDLQRFRWKPRRR